MAWCNHERPTYKTCRGYGRKPHECLYDKDFPMQKRRNKLGEVVLYAESLCRPCRRAYNRELKRMNSKLAGKAGTLGDLQLALTMISEGYSLRAAAAVARVARRTIKQALENPRRYQSFNELVVVDLDPFMQWFEDYLYRTCQTKHGFIMSMPNMSRSSWYESIQATGHLTVDMAERFFIHADEPWMMHIMEETSAVHHLERANAA